MTTSIDTIPLDAPYTVTDIQTGRVVYRTTYARRNAARRYADRKDIEYGAVRYVAGLCCDWLAARRSNASMEQRLGYPASSDWR